MKDETIEGILRDICDNVHSTCDERCPVFKANDGDAPDTLKDFKKNRGCDCFKDGKKMRLFLEARETKEPLVA